MCPGIYFEGGLDLTALGLGEECTATFTMDTRSSGSVDASLQDLAIGELGKCESSIETTAGSPASSKIEKGEVSSGKDSAKVKLEGISTWSGTVDFYICGPIETGACSSGGVKANGTTGNVGVEVSNTNATVESGSATLTSVGRYCWFATFTPDSATKAKGVKGAEDDGSGHTPNPECFEIAPVKPTLTTKASCTHTPCVLTVDTLEDTAKLEGTANAPGTNGPNATYKSINATNGAPADSSISWTLYGPGGTGSKPGCENSKTLSPSTAAVSGDGTYGPVSYKPTLTDGVGTYTFVASYGGESPNTEKATPTGCPDTTGTETITLIGKATIASKQRWLPNDRVVVESSGGALNGTLTATLYPSNNCTGTAVSGQTYTTTLTSQSSPFVFQTSNTTFYVGTNPDGTAGGAAGAYSWNVHYVDKNLESPTDRCETSTVSPITDSP
jgi:hypothetical protein